MAKANKTLEEIKNTRIDISDYLFHFTNGIDAKEVLSRIIDEGKIKDVKKQGYICFTEAPLPLLPDMFELFSKYQKPMYAPFGIAVKKNGFYDVGGRQVIYGDVHEENLLDESIRWRFLKHSPQTSDYTWLREWRIAREEIDINPKNAFLITNTELEEYELGFDDDPEIDIDGCMGDGEIQLEYYANRKRIWKTISMESIKKLEITNRIDLHSELKRPKKGDELRESLGWG